MGWRDDRKILDGRSLLLRRSRVFTGRVPKRKDRINREIRENEVRLIDESGDHVGLVPIAEALRRSEEAGMDLVEVSSAARPFVCRIMDYGNYKYERSKKAKEAKKKQHSTGLKEVKMRPRISEHDYDFKTRNAKKFLLHGDKVKFVVMFRGRERSHIEFGYKLLERVAQELDYIANVEARPGHEGRFLIMVMCPDSVKIKSEKARLEKEQAALDSIDDEAREAMDAKDAAEEDAMDEAAAEAESEEKTDHAAEVPVDEGAGEEV